MKLKESEIELKEPEHRYFDKEGKEYFGITGMVKRQLFPDKYKDVPEDVLMNAARKGSHIHSILELYDNTGLYNDSFVEDYQAKLDEMNLTHVESEFIVNDDYFATPIDKIYLQDGKYCLADVKTTYELDREYVSWQLSICEYLFKLLNPKTEIDKYYAVHVRNGVNIVEVSKKPVEEAIRLLTCERNGEQYVKPTDLMMPKEYSEASKDIQYILEQADYYAKKKKELQENLLVRMEDAKVKKWENDYISFSRKEDTTRESFDTKAFQKDHPELYKEYLKYSNVKGSVTIKVKQNLLSF